MKFCVIGLGRFGYQVAIMLAEHGMEVLAVDSNETTINAIRDQVTQAVCMRVSDETSLRNIGVDEMDIVIVSMGENLAQSILMTALLKKRLNIPRVIARAINDIHKEILTLVGADQVLVPEKEIAIRLADNLSSSCEELIRLNKLFAVAFIRSPQRFVGKRIKDLDLINSYGIQCIGIKNADTDLITLVQPDQIIKKDDLLICAGNKDDLENVAQI